MTRSRALAAGVLAVCAFLGTAFGLGALVLFGLVAFVIGPHGAGIVPEWANLPLLIVCVGAVSYVAFRVAMWMQDFVASKE